MLLKYFASIYPLGASVLKHLIILECPTSGQRAFDPIFKFFVKSPPIARTLTPRD
jgi:hypothetical protein